MTLIRKSNWPFSDLSRFDDLFNSDPFFGSNGNPGASVPAINIKETDTHYTIEVAAPGLTREDFSVRVNHRILTISSEKKEESETTEANYTRREFAFSSFKRSFSLPDHVDEDAVQARYEDGVLNLTLEKTGNAKVQPTRQIEVH